MCSLFLTSNLKANWIYNFLVYQLIKSDTFMVTVSCSVKKYISIINMYFLCFLFWQLLLLFCFVFCFVLSRKFSHGSPWFSILSGPASFYAPCLEVELDLVGDSLLTDRIWQKWQTASSWIGYQRWWFRLVDIFSLPLSQEGSDGEGHWGQGLRAASGQWPWELRCSESQPQSSWVLPTRTKAAWR